MTDKTAKPPMALTTAKVIPVVVNANHTSVPGPTTNAIPPTNMITIVDATSSAGDASNRKKSGFVITRVDKASNSATILESESDFENEVNDHGYARGGAGSPGSSSVMSEASTVDGGSLEKPLTVSRAPPPTPAGATPTGPAWPASQHHHPHQHQHQHHQRPGGLTAIISANSAVAGAAALLSAAASLGQQSGPTSQVQQAVVIASQSPSSAPPSTIHRETSASSRFHIIKIETGPYKRGRWNCRDFDESASGSGSGAVRSDMIAVGPRSGSSSNSSGRPSYHIIAEENGHGAGDHTLLLLTAASDQTTSHQQTSQQAGGLASKPPLPTGHHQHHHPHASSNQPSQQQHSPLPTTLPQSQQAKAADHSTTASISTNAAPAKGAAIVKQQSVTSQQPTGSISASNSAPLSNIAQQHSHQRSQSPVVSTTAAPTASAPSSATITVAAAASGPSAPTAISRFQVRPAAVDLNNAAAAILDSIVGSMQNDNNRIVIGAGGRQQASAITSSSTGSAAATGATAIASVVDGPIGGGGTTAMGQAAALAPGSVGANVVAIDNKIEQAMDLVKTHLLYAVREEVEVLKEKIIDLEKKVFRLETENKLLREYAPPEILQQIQHQHHQQQPSSSASSAGASVSSQSNSNASSVSIPQQQQPPAQPSVTQVATPTVTTYQSNQGSTITNVSPPVITTAPTAALSSASVQHHQPHQ